MGLRHNNDERKNQDNSRNDIRNAFRVERFNNQGIPLDAQRELSDIKLVKHERDTSERKIDFRRKTT